MGKRIKILDLPFSGLGIVLTILSTAFVLGGLVGCIFADRISGSSGGVLSEYLNGYFSAVRSGYSEKPEVLFLIWNVIRWPAIVMLFCLTPIGIIGIPLLFLIRGFLLSFSITSFYGAMGTDGLLIAFCVFGITEVISIPVLFSLGIECFQCSGMVAGRLMGEHKKDGLFKRSTLLCFGICIIALFVCSLVEYHVVPAIIVPLTDHLFGI